MSFKFFPRGNYSVGATIVIDDVEYVVERITSNGNLVAANANKHITVILTDEPPIEGVEQ